MPRDGNPEPKSTEIEGQESFDALGAETSLDTDVATTEDASEQIETPSTQSVHTTTESAPETNSARQTGKRWLKIGAAVVVVAGAGFAYSLFGGPGGGEDSETDEELAGTVPTTQLVEETTTTSIELSNELSFDEMLTSFVDEYGMPNRQIQMTTTDPEDFVDILLHNASCAINTRDVTCADNVYFNEKNPPALQDTIDIMTERSWFIEMQATEIISIDDTGSGEITVLAVVEDDILIRGATFEGSRDDTSIQEIVLRRYSDGTLANTRVTIVQKIDDD